MKRAYDSSLFKPLKPDHNQKSEEKATMLREQGNTHLRNNDKENALSLYSQSIAYAPPNSKALPLAFANRAAVLKDMGHFADSIADNQRALKTGYPENLRYKLYLRLGISFKGLGRNEQALKSYNEAADALENSSTLDEKEKQRVQLNVESHMKYFDGDEEEATEFEDLTGDKSIGVLKFDVPSLGSNVNPEIPSASDCIALKYNKTYGRHLVATRDIEQGEVLIVEDPLVTILEPSLCFSHCSHCLKRSRTLLPCQQCTWAMFCSEACIEESRSYHQLECAVMPSYFKEESLCYLRLAARLVFQTGFDKFRQFFEEQRNQNKSQETPEQKRTAGFNKEGKYISTDLNTAANLSHYSVDDHEMMMQGFDVVKLMILLEFDKHDTLPAIFEIGGFLLRLTSSYCCNMNYVTEFHKKEGLLGDFKGVACSLFPTYALINHSCNGNIFYHFYGKTMVVRASRFIQKGQQIFTITGKSFLKYPLQYRQNHFKKNYHFTCCCEACVGDWPLAEDMPNDPSFSPSEKQMAKKVTASLVNLMKKGIGNPESGWRVTAETLPMFEAHFKLLDKNGKFLNYQYCILMECIRYYYCMLGNHVGKVEDDGLKNCADQINLYVNQY